MDHLTKLLDEFYYFKMSRNNKESSLKNYVLNIKTFFKFIDKEVDAVILDDLNAYYLHLKIDKKNAVNTQKIKLTSIRLFYDWYSVRYHKENPTELMPIIQEDIRIPIMPTPDEFTRMVYACDKTTDIGLRDATILCLLADTGIRRGECSSLNMSNIQLHENNFVCVVPRLKSYERMVPFAALTAGALVGEYFTSYYNKRRFVESAGTLDPLFIQMGITYSGSRLLQQGINFIVKKCARRAGIEKLLTAHSFRHFFATYSFINGTDIMQLKGLMGHAWLSTTERYIHIAEAIQADSLGHRATTKLKAPENWQGFVNSIKGIRRDANKI